MTDAEVLNMQRRAVSGGGGGEVNPGGGRWQLSRQQVMCVSNVRREGGCTVGGPLMEGLYPRWGDAGGGGSQHSTGWDHVQGRGQAEGCL